MEFSVPMESTTLRLPGIALHTSSEENSEPDCHRALDCPNTDFDATPLSGSAGTPWFDATPQSFFDATPQSFFDATPQSFSAETPWSQWDGCDYSKCDRSMQLMGNSCDAGVVDPVASQSQFMGSSYQPGMSWVFGYFPQTDESYDCGPYNPMDPAMAPTSIDGYQPFDSQTSPTDGYQPLDRQTSPTAHAECDSGNTTVMLRNIPGNYTDELLEEHLNEEGFAACYDGIYLPKDLKNDLACVGYAFINLNSPEQATRFKEHFHGFNRWRNSSKKWAETSWGNVQGLQQFIRQYRNSPIMHDTIPECCKPRLFSDGVQVPFPAPTKNLVPPKIIGKKKLAPKAAVQWQ